MEATIGGTKRHLLELCEGLPPAGWAVEVACPRVRQAALGDVSFWDDLRARGVPAHALPMRRAPLSGTNVRAVLRLARLIRRRRYDVVHAHSSIAGAVARPAVLLSGRRPGVVYTPHGFAFLTPGGRGRQALYLSIERALGRVTDRLIAVSPTEGDEAVRYGVIPAARVVTIPNGVATGELPSPARRAEVRRREGWGDAPLVGTVSRMTQQKDPFTWLQTAARIAAVRADVRFVWIWSGELEPEVRREAAALGLVSRLHFLGYRADARDLIAALDVYLLTSRFEGLPYTVLEAMASGVPVVATDVVGTRDVVRQDATGLLAPAGEPSALAAHVLRVLEQPELARRLGEAARDEVGARFSVQGMVTRTAELYEGLRCR
ncbi:MAG TPA: glycosyltransferase family 4 protein [Chloroflexota bacterium]|nr:glycosyltransferase family 4 protein [Chloroflexota bacterium]